MVVRFVGYPIASCFPSCRGYPSSLKGLSEGQSYRFFLNNREKRLLSCQLRASFLVSRGYPLSSCCFSPGDCSLSSSCLTSWAIFSPRRLRATITPSGELVSYRFWFKHCRQKGAAVPGQAGVASASSIAIQGYEKNGAV